MQKTKEGKGYTLVASMDKKKASYLQSAKSQIEYQHRIQYQKPQITQNERTHHLKSTPLIAMNPRLYKNPRSPPSQLNSLLVIKRRSQQITDKITTKLHHTR